MMFLIGGAEQTATHTVVHRLIHTHHLKRVAVVLSATRYKREVYTQYKELFEGWGCEVQDIGKPSLAAAVRVIDWSDMVFFTGGDQQKIEDKLHGTDCLARIQSRYHQGLVVAGTSAGAMALSTAMLSSDAGDYRPGLGLIPITIDTHFSQRERLLRLFTYMRKHHIAKGLGIDEDTCVVLEGDQYSCYGQGDCCTITNTETNININIYNSGTSFKL